MQIRKVRKMQMTIDEAIKELRDASDSEVRYGDKDNHYDKVMKRVEAFEMAIKALEQQPCEDCISREAVIKIFGEVHPMDYNTQAYITNIQNLPSVTPSRPNGKWKKISPAGIYECTNCNQMIMTSDIDCYKYCHGCGVRMEGEE